MNHATYLLSKSHPLPRLVLHQSPVGLHLIEQRLLAVPQSFRIGIAQGFSLGRHRDRLDLGRLLGIETRRVWGGQSRIQALCIYRS